MTQTVTIHGKTFGLAISANQIQVAVARIAEQITQDLALADPFFVCLLNGSYVFAADLLRAINFPAEISFAKVSSYEGMQQSKNIQSLIGLPENIAGRTIVLVEDIIDTGKTMNNICSELMRNGAVDIKIATMLFKPNAFRYNYPIHYIGIEIGNEFVVGYGMDYNALGRNLKDIYQLI